MSRRSLSILFVLLAVVALGVVWLVGGIGGSKDGTSTAPTTADRSDEGHAVDGSDLVALPPPGALPFLPVESPPPPRERVGATAPDFDPELANAIWIDGRVVVPGGTPADESVVVVAEGAPFERRDYHRAPIGPDGSFRVAFARETGMGVLRIEARYLYLKTFVSVRIPTNGREVVLRPLLGGCIRGRVLLPLAGAPPRDSIVGSKVTASTLEPQVSFSSEKEALGTAVVDDDLQFELRGVPDVGSCFIDMESSEASCVEPPNVEVDPGRVSIVDLLVETNARIAGVVVDPDGQPARNSVVHVGRPGQGKLRGTAPAAQTAADDEGRFELRGLVRGAYELWASADGAVESKPMELELLPGQVVADLTVRLSRGGRIVGQLIDFKGRPRPRVAIGASSEGFRHFGQASTDEQGRFEIESLVPGEYRVSTGFLRHSEQDAASTQESRRSVFVRVEDGQTTEVVLGGRRLDAVTIEGTVRVGGQTAADWRVSAFPVGEMEGFASATCDARGNYVLVLDRSGWFTFNVGSPRGSAALTESVEVPAATSLRRDFDLDGAGRVTGRVVDEKGAPVASVEVTALPEPGAGKLGGRQFSGLDTTDARGDFAFEGLPGGTYRLEARKGSTFGEGSDAGRASLEGVRVGDAETIDGLVLTIQDCCSVEVFLRRADGKTVPEVSVEPEGQGSIRSTSSYSSRSDASPSRFVLNGLRPGNVTIHANAQDPPLAGTATVVVAPGVKGKVEIVLQPATTLLVRLDTSGRDPREVLVVVRDERGVLVGASDPDASVAMERRFGPFSTGRYTILAEHPDGASTQGTIEITGGAEVVASLHLGP